MGKTLTLELPETLYRRLEEKAKREAKPLDETVLRLLEEGLGELDPAEERRRVLEVLRSSGLWQPPGPEWDEYIKAAEGVTVKEIRKMLEGIPPLSEDIIAMRGER